MILDPFAGRAVMHGYPVDPDILRTIQEGMSAELHFQLTPEHVQNTCDRCNMPVWLGPRQNDMVQATFPPTIVLCSLCVVAAAESQEADLAVYGLNPDL